MHGRICFSLALCTLLFETRSTAAEPSDPLDIYVVRGDAAQLQRFDSEIAKGWLGGKFLGRLSTKSEYRYWAYSSRTASQARVFMFGSMNYGLRLDFEAYQERTYYPAERALLDEIALRCRLKSNALFIEPDRTVLVNPQAADKEVTDCVTTELKKAKAGADMPLKLLANSLSERG